MSEEIRKTIEDTIKVTVNGKIDTIRQEQQLAHKQLREEIADVKVDVKEVLDAFRETSDFFKVSMRIARYITVVGGAIALLFWGKTKL